MRIRSGVGVLARVSLVVLCLPPAAWGGDWPQWRYDAGRTACSPEQLAAGLHLQWRRQLPAPKPAWPKYPRMQFDASYEPVVAGKTMFVPSMVTDSLTALDAATGAEKWRFYADGPVRFAPVAWRGKVYFVSDDGHLYCLNAADGKLLWKFRPLPADRKPALVLGNERLISLWPARGGPVLADGTLYFAAGIWPFEGVYVYAIDAATGKAVWSNTGSGLVKDGLVDHGLKKGPKGESGLAPQGYLTVVGERLIVPCGRALPAFIDRRTGRLERYLTGWGGRVTLAKGSWYAAALGKYFAHTGDLCELATRAHLEVDPANHKEIGRMRRIVMTGDAIYYSRPVNTVRRDSYRPVGGGCDRIVACDITEPTIQTKKDRRREDWKRATLRMLWSLPSELEVHMKAGGRLYAGAPGVVAAVDIPEAGARPKIAWRAGIEGTPARMLAADGKLFAVTREGAIYCFGPERLEARRHELPAGKVGEAGGRWGQRAARILKQTTARRIAESQKGEPTIAMRFEGEPVDVSWPTAWQAFGPMPKATPLLPPGELKTIPKKLARDGTEYPARPLPSVDATLDFSSAFGGYGLKPLPPGQKPTAFPRPKARRDDKMRMKLAYAMAEIDCPTAGRLTIGAGATGRMVWYLDGRCIYDPNSNEGVWTYYGLRGRMFSTDVSAGRHVVAVAVHADSRGWSVTAEGGARREAAFKAEMAGTPHTEVMQGYALVWGLGTGRLAEELVRQSALHVIAVDPDAAKVDAFRRRMTAAGLYGRRVVAHAGRPVAAPFPPYLADLITSEDASVLLAGAADKPAGSDEDRAEALAARAFHCLRPFGGVAFLRLPAAVGDDLAERADAIKPDGATIARAGRSVLLRRDGALSGSTDWTHERGDAANTYTSRDRLVRMPLRVLWFGGSVDRFFPDWDYTHSRHPIPLVAGGRIFFLTGWSLSAADAYTGRFLWKVALPSPERWYHTYAAGDDGLYVVCGGRLRRLDPATGRTLAVIDPPAGTTGPWRQIRISEELLIGRVGNHAVALGRGDEKMLWSHSCKRELTDLAIGRGRVFLLDCPPPGRSDKATSEARLVALDGRKGKILWESPVSVWAGPRSRPRVAWCESSDSVIVQHRGMAAFGAASGKPLWQHQARQAAPYVVHPTAVVNGRTGEKFDPHTGEKRTERLWSGPLRGCSHAVASEYVLTLRDGHASYFDLPSGKRTFMRGIRSGCTPSQIPANGLINIPNFARGCSCNYSIFTSLALVPGEE